MERQGCQGADKWDKYGSNTTKGHGHNRASQLLRFGIRQADGTLHHSLTFPAILTLKRNWSNIPSLALLSG